MVGSESSLAMIMSFLICTEPTVLFISTKEEFLNNQIDMKKVKSINIWFLAILELYIFVPVTGASIAGYLSLNFSLVILILLTLILLFFLFNTLFVNNKNRFRRAILTLILIISIVVHLYFILDFWDGKIDCPTCP